MTIKELIKKSYDDFLNLEFNLKNILILSVVTIVLSSVSTPIIGIPVGVLGTAYYLQRKSEK
ncbi:VraH family peptide resistance protein [Staphylococcus cohnii]